MKIFKKLALVVAGVCTVAGLMGGMSKTAQAADYRETGPAIFGVSYSGRVGGGNEADAYKFVVPSTGKVTLTLRYNENSGPGYRVTLYDAKGNRVIYGMVGRKNGTNTYTRTVAVKKGTYLFEIDSYGSSGGSYKFKTSYNFAPATTVKLSSPSAGTGKIVAAASDGSCGFQVRYKKVGAKNWTTKTVATKKNLNKTVKLTSKASYAVQVRLYTRDSYGNTYFSGWTKQQTVKIK